MTKQDELTESTADTREQKESSVLVLRSIVPEDVMPLIVLGNQRLLLGREGDCDVRIPRAKVSRHHALLTRQGPIYTLRDLESRNRTFLNGNEVSECPLVPNSILRLGDWLGSVDELSKEEIAVGRGALFSELAPSLLGGPVLARVLKPLISAARTPLSVVLEGATGVGKERFARAVHSLSGRRGPFHAVNCAALPTSLAEAELFGYRRGAFTGAERAHEGHFRAAHHGTLFLDEVAELPLEVQAKILRVIEQQCATPLGETREVAFDTRVVVALQRPFSELIREGSFRADLAARLSGITVRIPPLKERRADVPHLFRHFLGIHSPAEVPAVSTKLYERLCLYSWPANVRELEQVARELSGVYWREPVLRRSHLPEHVRADSEAREEPVSNSLRGQDRQRLLTSLQETGGNVKRAAQLIGMSRQRAYRLIGGGPERDVLKKARGIDRD